ncbi:MAG: zinc ribbon domain-containing protein [Blastocatellia bacterium]
MYCPKCASQIADKQNYCRNCGLKLDVIVDAMEDRPPGQGPFDFETLKRDLRDLGSSLRAGFEKAHIEIKNTRKLNKTPAPPAPASSMPSGQDWSREISKAVWSHEFSKALKKVKAAHSRKYSLQQATLSIFGGGAVMAVWYYLLEAATNSELLRNLEMIILEKTGTYVTGLVPVIQMLWLLGLIPVARGVAHLINGIFFAPQPEKQPEPQPGFPQSYIQPPPAYVSAAANPATNDLETERNPQSHMSVTEDATLRFEPK